LFLPVETVTYFATRYNEQGIGVSLLDEMKIVNSQRAVLMFANTMGGIKNSISRTQVDIKFDENDPDPQNTLELQMDALMRANTNMFPLGVHLPDGRAVGHLPELIARWPHSPVLLMSGQVNEADVDAARAHGAAGFLSKTASAHEIVAAVQRACEGSGAVFDAWTSPYTAPHVSGQTLSVAEVRPSYGDDGSLQLDARQRDILRYLGRNTPNKAIARQLGLSEDQVRVTVSWLTEALNASSRLQAYETALARGLLRS
jgi:DNA-binding NarL/FixJ family response regulator